MNIIVITELFKTGGLETQTIGFCKYLKKKGHEIFLVVGKESRIEPLTKIVGNRILVVDINPSLTGWEVAQVVDKISDFALQNSCAIVHCHPFISILIGGLVAAKINKPFVVSLHGPVSLSSVYGSVYKMLLENIFLSDAWRVFCVSPEVKNKAIKSQKSGKYFLLPNGVDLDSFSPTNPSGNGPWAVVARLDGDKIPGIKHFIKCWALIREKSNLGDIHIFGDGSCKAELEQWTKQEYGELEWIIFKGHSGNLANDLKSGYSGIVGMGRVVLEGAALNLPIILVGYDGVKGLVSTSTATEWYQKNFSGRGLVNIDAEQLETQINALKSCPSMYYLREWVTVNASEEIIWNNYLRQIEAPEVPTYDWEPSIRDLLIELGDRKLLGPETIPRLIEILEFTKSEDQIDWVTSILISENLRQQEELIVVRTTEAMLRQAIFEQRVKLEERIEKSEKELLILTQDKNQALIDLTTFKENSEYKYSVQINNILKELEVTSQNLSLIRTTRAYQLAHFLKLFRSEFVLGNWIQKKQFVNYVIKWLGGFRGGYTDQNSLLSIEKNIQSLTNKIIQTNTSSLSFPCLTEKLKINKEISHQKIKPGKGVKPTVAYLTNQVVDWFDLRPRFGGGERYCLSLSNLLRNLGFEVTIFQAGTKEFEADYYGFKVIGIPIKEYFSEFHYGVCNEFYKHSLNYDYVIYNLPEYASGLMRDDAIMICHGIWFDHNNYSEPISFRTPTWFEHLYRSFSNPRSITSVDTNSINVIRAMWPELAPKMHFIPNFVDTSMFFPSSKERNQRPLTVLFPRRSQINRGSRILEEILANIPHNCQFLWVGEGDAADTQLIKDIAAKDSRLKYYSASFEEMPKYYQNTDICVIPTIACEGTSLSCIESLASGCATISTNVGGLSDIVQSGVNGILVDPTPKAIAGAINFLIENPKEREYLQRAAIQSAQNFNLQRWRARWIKLLTHLGWIDKDNVKSEEAYMWF